MSDGETPNRPRGRGARRRGGPGRPRGRLWWALSVAVLAAVVAVAVVRRSEVAAAVRLVVHADPLLLLAALGCEALSLLCFAGVWRWLLDAGGARWPLRRAAALTMGGNAVAGALPGGAILATAWAFRQLRRRAVDPALAGAVLAVAGALSALGLGVLAAVALLAAGPAARSLVVWTALALLLALAVAAVALALVRRSAAVRRALRALWARAARRFAWADALGNGAARVAEQAWNLRPGLRPWLRPAALALLNWVFDLGCLILCLRALHVTVVWPGVLDAYLLTQLPASLRLTPGNLGVVEAGLTALLAAYGVPAREALAAALLYRAVSFWAFQPVGWACWAAVTLHGRQKP